MEKILPDFSVNITDSQKSIVRYDEDSDIICVTILDNDRTLDDIEDTAKYICNIQENTGSCKILYDHSRFEWKFDYLSEYKLGKDFGNLLPYASGTKISFYLGEHYDPEYWGLLEKLINENSGCTIRYFGDKQEAFDYLK